jgi:hypothetical protein
MHVYGDRRSNLIDAPGYYYVSKGGGGADEDIAAVG